MESSHTFVSQIIIPFKDPNVQETNPVPEAYLKEEDPGKTSSIYEAVIRPILNILTEKYINKSSQNTTPQECKPLLEASK